MSDSYEGRCLCGTVRFSATGPPKSVFWCHCESCRRHSGAPASVFVGFENSAFTVTAGEIATYDSSPGTRRGFCARCGSTLTCATVHRPTETHFHIGTFERAAELKPRGEVFASERLPWMHAG